MAEHIDRGTAIAKLTALDVIEPNATMVGAKRLLAEIPAAEVAPVVHGRWNVIEGRMLDNAICSNCGRRFQAYYEAYSFCPNCGAKMDGGGERDG